MIILVMQTMQIALEDLFANMKEKKNMIWQHSCIGYFPVGSKYLFVSILSFTFMKSLNENTKINGGHITHIQLETLIRKIPHTGDTNSLYRCR